MAEVSMKLIKSHALTRGERRDVLRMDMGVLPCPPYFDHVIFIFEPHPERNSIAGARFEYDARVHSCDMGINRKAHAGAITDEWTEIETQRFWLRVLYRTMHPLDLVQIVESVERVEREDCSYRRSSIPSSRVFLE